MARSAARAWQAGGLRTEAACSAGFLLRHSVCDLPWIAWQGAWVLVLIGVFVAEIVLTLTDFVVEIAVRKQLGDVYAGERVTHAIMGILYGAMIAKLIPVLGHWWDRPTALALDWAPIPGALRWALVVMPSGVLLSGLRDLYAALEFPNGNWPWKSEIASASR
jgi:hypothetical protein